MAAMWKASAMSYRTIWNHVEHLFGHRAEPLREALLSSVRAGRIILNTILSRNPGPVVAAVASILSVGQTSAAVEDPGAERLELNPLYDQFDYGSYTQLVTLGAGDANQMQSEFLARVYLPVPESVNPVTGQLEPTGLNPPYPVVLFVHGNHATCVDANGNATTSWMLPPSLPCGASGEEIANYAGYGYVGKLLAERGIAVVSKIGRAHV